jgi:hypothetical protein
MLRAARTLAVFATIALVGSCRSVEDPFPSQTTFDFDITDSSAASQFAPLPAPQVVSWRVDAMTASNVTGFAGTYSFLFAGPCSYELNAAASVPFTSACHTSGLLLTSTTQLHSATLSITLSRLELRSAARPDLSPSADPDGDGVPNSADNCPIVFNPDQANVNAALEANPVGDACSDLDTAGAPTIPDQDLDGVPDQSDNCIWYPNPRAVGELTAADGNHDGIGDACERFAPVVFVSGPMTIQCDNVTFAAEPSSFALFRMDFGRPGVITCDSGFSGCTLNPNALKVSQIGKTATFSCRQVS